MPARPEYPRGRHVDRRLGGIRDADGHVAPRSKTWRPRPSSGLWHTPRRRRPLRHCQRVHQSVRGNDPDAALYWLASMIAAGRTRDSSPEVDHPRIGGCRPRRSARFGSCRRGGPGPGLGRPARGSVRAGPGDRDARGDDQEQRRGPGLLRGHGRRSGQRLLQVPAHLRSSGAGRRNYRYPHDFDGDDVDQQYLPTSSSAAATTSPANSVPSEDRRVSNVCGKDERSGRRKPPVAGRPNVDPMAAGSEGMRLRRQSLRDLADEQRRDGGK